MEEAGCIRGKDLRDGKATIIFNVNNDDLANTIKRCVENHDMGHW